MAMDLLFADEDLDRNVVFKENFQSVSTSKYIL